MKTVVVVYGTRPEAVKLAPVVLALHKDPSIRTIVASTGQHTDLLTQAESCLNLVPDVKLSVGTSGQTLHQSFASILEQFSAFCRSGTLPDMVIVQGDTTTAVAVAVAASYLKIPVAHVEAGLRTHDQTSPFPEETNRVIIDHVSSLLFAPTYVSAANLNREGIRTGIHVVGNTVVDAFNMLNLKAPVVVHGDKPYLVLTMHRRENFGSPMRNVCKSMLKIASSQNVDIVIPVHPNPEVQKVVNEELGDRPGIRVVPPMSYVEFLQLMQGSLFILSDSGGVQEEATLLHKPVLILRKNTERPEVLDCGVGKLVGTDEEHVFSCTTHLINHLPTSNTLTSTANPFGEGNTSQAIVQIIHEFFGM